MSGTLLARASAWILSLAALWWIATEGRPGSWGVGIPVVIMAAFTATAVTPAPRWRIRPLGLARFLGHFLAGSVRGGVDVARRVLSPTMRLAPGFLTHRLSLPEGAPRVLLANVISLMPGTLTVDLVGEELHLHALDAGPDLAGELGELERRVGDVFASVPVPGEEGP